MANWTPRQPRLDYGPEDTMRELSALIIGLAQHRSKEISAEKDRKWQESQMYIKSSLDSLNLLETSMLAKEEEAMKLGILEHSLSNVSPETQTKAGMEITGDRKENINVKREAIQSKHDIISSGISEFYKGKGMAVHLDVDASGRVDPNELAVAAESLGQEPSYEFNMGVYNWTLDPDVRKGIELKEHEIAQAETTAYVMEKTKEFQITQAEQLVKKNTVDILSARNALRMDVAEWDTVTSEKFVALLNEGRASTNAAQNNLGDYFLNNLFVLDDKKKFNTLQTYLAYQADPAVLKTEIGKIANIDRYDLIENDLIGMISATVGGAIDAEKTGMSPRHGLIRNIKKVYDDVYKPVMSDPFTDEHGNMTTLHGWIQSKIKERQDRLIADGKPETYEKSLAHVLDAEKRIRDRSWDTGKVSHLSEADDRRYREFLQWSQTGVFENMEQVRMASNAIIQQDQWLDINDKYIIQRTAAQLDPDYYGAPFGMGADEETGIRTIMDKPLDDAMEELFQQSRQSLTLPDEE